MSTNLEQSVAAARKQLDEQTVKIVRLHFDPELGAPFWLEKAKTYDFDPLTDINCFDDLKKFPLVRRRLASRRTGHPLPSEEVAQRTEVRLRNPAVRPALPRVAASSVTTGSTTKSSRGRCPTNTSRPARTG